MIRLPGPIPPILRENAARLDTNSQRPKSAGQPPTDAEGDLVTATPTSNSHWCKKHPGKCAYCESKVRHITYVDVEHIVPKSTDLERRLIGPISRWPATSATRAKVTIWKPRGSSGSVRSGTANMNFLGAMVIPRPGSALASPTESTIRLNRIELVERRSEIALLVWRGYYIFSLSN